MTDKTGRQIDLVISIDAPVEEAWKALTTGAGIRNWFCLDAKVNNPGPAGSVWLSFGEGMDWESQIGAWDENQHVSWVDEYERSGSKVRLAVDFYITSEKGQTKVRLVHSGFGDDSSWDSEIEGLTGGWAYFIFPNGGKIFIRAKSPPWYGKHSPLSTCVGTSFLKNWLINFGAMEYTPAAMIVASFNPDFLKSAMWSGWRWRAKSASGKSR